MRTISYVDAIREATDLEMSRDDSVILFGLDVDDPKAIQGTTRGLAQKFGPSRVFGTPLSEDAMTGVAIGMAMAGLRPIHVHIRMDFVLLAMNQLVNIASKAHFMYGGQVRVPVVVRSMIGRSWGQGAQHSQALYSFFMHVPGFKVVAPTNPHDAKGTLIAAIRDDNPVMFVEHRFLHFSKGPVPENSYDVGPGKARIVQHGSDVTLVGISHALLETVRAARYLESVGVKAEVIDPIWLAPLDIATIIDSVKRTGALCVVDNGWTSCGGGAEIVARVVESIPDRAIRVLRLGFAPTTCPPTPSLEHYFYPDGRTIASAVYDLVTGKPQQWMPDERADLAEIEFRGPF